MGRLDDLARARVRQWLQGSGLTQGAFAEQIDRNASWMSRWLDGDWEADLDTLSRMAGVFDHTLFELLDQPTGNAEEQELIERFRATRASTREAALTVFREMTTPTVARGRTRKSGGAARHE